MLITFQMKQFFFFFFPLSHLRLCLFHRLGIRSLRTRDISPLELSAMQSLPRLLPTLLLGGMSPLCSWAPYKYIKIES